MNTTKKAILEHQKQCDEMRAQFKEKDLMGPWMDEPDRVEFNHKGFACLLIRHPSLFHWCGYVGLSPDHSYFDKEDPDDANIDIHGGITYSKKCKGAVCHIPKEGEKEDLFWLGFDCAHLGDNSPGRDFFMIFATGRPSAMNAMGKYRDVKYVQSETKSLAEQLSVL